MTREPRSKTDNIKKKKKKAPSEFRHRVGGPGTDPATCVIDRRRSGRARAIVGRSAQPADECVGPDGGGGGGGGSRDGIDARAHTHFTLAFPVLGWGGREGKKPVGDQ